MAPTPRIGARLSLVALALAVRVADAAPPEPTGAHPRMLLDAELRAAWQAQAREGRGPVVGAIALCTDGQGRAHDRGLYQGAAWARMLQACLVAWAATEGAERTTHAATAVKFMTALLDDREQRGDGAGGDTVAQRDAGYAIRNHGPYTALAYDWLHDEPVMTPALQHKARERWRAWLDWYQAKGYRARAPGTNYQAGYLAAATMIAVAQGGEAAEERGGERWAFVADELWGQDMAAALADGGILDGGDWPEGWQYGPLAVAHYALAARIARAHGIAVTGIEAWLGSVLRRHVHGLSPADHLHVGQDTQVETPTIAPHMLTLAAVALGDAAPEDQQWAKGELVRLTMADRDYLLFGALASVGARPARIPRERWPTWYVARATGTLFARTRWDPQGVFLVAECQRRLDVDHRHPKAGNVVLSRGADDVLVDPSPYGSASTLTSNAPTVASAQLPAAYGPSQGAWGGERVRWTYAVQARSGVVAARCDYADAYRFQRRSSDVPEAARELVLVPGAAGTDAVLLVIDRARTGGDHRGMDLRFRVPGGLTLAGDTATAVIGATRLAITSALRSSGTPVLGHTTQRTCTSDGGAKGRCDAARFDTTDLRLALTGPAPRAVTAIAVTAPGTPAPVPTPRTGPGWEGVELTGPRAATVVWPTGTAATLRYRGRPGAHVILDAPHLAGLATITGTRDGDACAIAVTPGGLVPARPAVLTVDEACGISVDPASAASATGTRPPAPSSTLARSPRSGCCGAQVAPGSPLVIGLVLLVGVRRRRQPRTPR